MKRAGCDRWRRPLNKFRSRRNADKTDPGALDTEVWWGCIAGSRKASRLPRFVSWRQLREIRPRLPRTVSPEAGRGGVATATCRLCLVQIVSFDRACQHVLLSSVLRCYYMFRRRGPGTPRRGDGTDRSRKWRGPGRPGLREGPVPQVPVIALELSHQVTATGKRGGFKGIVTSGSLIFCHLALTSCCG